MPDTVTTLAALWRRQTALALDPLRSDDETDDLVLLAGETLRQIARTPAANVAEASLKAAVLWRDMHGETGGEVSNVLMAGLVADLERLAAPTRRPTASGIT